MDYIPDQESRKQGGNGCNETTITGTAACAVPAGSDRKALTSATVWGRRALGAVLTAGGMGGAQPSMIGGCRGASPRELRVVRRVVHVDAHDLGRELVHALLEAGDVRQASAGGVVGHHVDR